MANHLISFSVVMFTIVNDVYGSSLKAYYQSSLPSVFINQTSGSNKHGRCTPLPNYLGDGIRNGTEESKRSRAFERTNFSEEIMSESMELSRKTEQTNENPNKTRVVLLRHLKKITDSNQHWRCTPLPNYHGDGIGNGTEEYGRSEASEGTSSEGLDFFGRREGPDEIPNDTRVVLLRHIENNMEVKGQLDMLQQELKNLSRIVQGLGTSLDKTLLQQEKLKQDVITLSGNVTGISTSVLRKNKTLQKRIAKVCRRGRKNKRNQRKNTCPFPKAYAKGKFNECPEMFQRFWGKKQGTCLWFSNITASWAEALVYCAVMDSELAVLDNGDLRDNVTHYMYEQETVNMYYLGGSEYQDGDWKWLKPKKHFQIKSPPWKMGQREKAGHGELCLAITRSKQSRKRYNWTSVPCDRKIRFICQRKSTK